MQKPDKKDAHNHVKMMNMFLRATGWVTEQEVNVPNLRDIASLVSHLYSASFFSMVLNPEDHEEHTWMTTQPQRGETRQM